ncbi:MAG: UDP-N-acetylmuramate--L-alanine ligase [Alphaproteobacteria bacterium]|nr:UDP-N-acetylmuramate--L-alanine ligase [Rickettsiales bacterium]
MVENIKKSSTSTLEGKKIFFVGINGIGMSCIAILLHKMNYIVAGSCDVKNEMYHKIINYGIPVSLGHKSENIKNFNCIVFSTAIKNDNPELQYAKNNNIQVMHRSEMLGLLTKMFYTVGVMGSHGKTTVTSLIAFILHSVGVPINVTVGGILPFFGWNGNFEEKAKNIIVEIDESDGSFVNVRYDTIVINNISSEHLESYQDNLDNMINQITGFLKHNRKQGMPNIVLGIDDDCVRNKILPVAQQIVAIHGGKVLTFGTQEKADFAAKNITQLASGTVFDLCKGNSLPVKVKLPMYGRYNVLNSLGAIAAVSLTGVDVKESALAVSGFLGVDRRFSIIHRGSIIAIDDYAHHPKEVNAVLDGVNAFVKDNNFKRLICVFQPHRYTRVKKFSIDYIAAFSEKINNKGIVAVMPVYSAGESPILGATSKEIISKIQDNNISCLEINDNDVKEMTSFLANIVKNGDVILFIGAGSISNIARNIDFNKLEATNKH